MKLSENNLYKCLVLEESYLQLSPLYNQLWSGDLWQHTGSEVWQHSALWSTVVSECENINFHTSSVKDLLINSNLPYVTTMETVDRRVILTTQFLGFFDQLSIVLPNTYFTYVIIDTCWRLCNATLVLWTNRQSWMTRHYRL